MAGTYSIPEEGSPNSSQDPMIKTFMKSWNEKLNSENDLEDSGIASPNNSAYRPVFESRQIFSNEAGGVAGPFTMGGTSSPVETEANLVAATPRSAAFFYFAKADYEVAGKTQKLRLRAQAAVNATKPTIKFTIALVSLTVAGGANELKLIHGGVVGSSVEFNEPTASTISQVAGSDLTIPSDGIYALRVITSAKLNANSAVLLSAQLQTRSV